MKEGAVMSREQTVVHNTFVVEKSYPKPVETVFAAFADATKKRRWYGEGDGRTAESYSLDFREGGRELLRYKAPAGTPVADWTSSPTSASRSWAPGRPPSRSSRSSAGTPSTSMSFSARRRRSVCETIGLPIPSG